MSPPEKTVEIANRINTQLERFMPVLTPAGVILGFLLPQVFVNLRPFIPLLFSVMTLSGALKLRAREFGIAVRRPLPILVSFISSHVLIPLAVLVIASLVFRGDPDTLSGYLLVYSAPTAVASFIWVAIYRGDNALSLAIILLDTLLAPLVVPGTMSLLLGTRVSLDMSGIAVSLIIMVVIPTVAGVSINEASRGKIPLVVCPYFSPLAKFSMILIIAANASVVAPKIRFGEPLVWIVAALCVTFAIIGYIITSLACAAARLPPEKRATIFFAAGLRNISAATTIAIDFFPEAAALPALLGIVFQQTMAAIMGRLLLGKRSIVR
jgi:tagaturonate reductase